MVKEKQTLQKAYGNLIVAQRQGSPETCYFAKGSIILLMQQGDFASNLS